MNYPIAKVYKVERSKPELPEKWGFHQPDDYIKSFLLYLGEDVPPVHYTIENDIKNREKRTQ